MRPGEDLLLVDETLWVLAAGTGLPAYDFPIDRFFPCRRPRDRPPEVTVVGRAGAFGDYADRHRELLGEGLRLVHTPGEHLLSSELPRWYPLLAGLTPRSLWFDGPPSAREVGEALGWPVFAKGARQTSRHRRSLSILDGPEAFEAAMRAYRDDPILRWQPVVCREFVPLRPVEAPGAAPDRIPASFEFRSFWWRGRLAGIGPYWGSVQPYTLTPADRAAAVALAGEAARRVGTAFLVVDVAQAVDGRWIVIECNDGQESGHTGLSPLALWQAILELERESMV